MGGNFGFFQNQWNMWKIVPLRNLGIIQNCSVGVFFDAVFGNGRFYSRSPLSSRICSISAGVTTMGFLGKCFRLPVTR